MVCINKFDLNPEITAEIENYCKNHGFPVIGKIPFNPGIMKALQEYKTPVEAGNQQFIREVENLWEKLQEEMNMKIDMNR